MVQFSCDSGKRKFFAQNKQSPERNLRRFPFDTGAPAPGSVNFFTARVAKFAKKNDQFDPVLGITSATSGKTSDRPDARQHADAYVSPDNSKGYNTAPSMADGRAYSSMCDLPEHKQPVSHKNMTAEPSDAVAADAAVEVLVGHGHSARTRTATTGHRSAFAVPMQPT